MRLNLILMAGLPASGKSCFGEFASRELEIPILEKDEIKEYLFDTIGFKSRAEKTQLDIAATETMYYAAGRILSCGGSVLLDNNFENRSVPSLEKLILSHPCNVITVKFGGDVAVIYQRFMQRNHDPKRHPGHVSVTCYPEIKGHEDHGEDMTLEMFQTKFKQRGTIDFSMGKTIFVDATDFSKVSYPDIMKELRSLLA